MILERMNSTETPNGYKMVSIGDKVPAGTVLAWKGEWTGQLDEEWKFEQITDTFEIPSGYRCAALLPPETKEW